MSHPTEKYFPHLLPVQKDRLSMLHELYSYWNSRINVISRRDLGNLDTHHILHSLSIAKAISFKAGTRILDIGTGGGFPGIPLAILFPDCRFVLTDSIGKKIKVVKEIAAALKLSNVEAVQTRAEAWQGTCDFVTGRAVTDLPSFIRLAEHRISAHSENDLPNGIFYLKGGEFPDEMAGIRYPARVFSLSDWFTEDFFDTKKLIHIAIG